MEPTAKNNSTKLPTSNFSKPNQYKSLQPDIFLFLL